MKNLVLLDSGEFSGVLVFDVEPKLKDEDMFFKIRFQNRKKMKFEKWF